MSEMETQTKKLWSCKKWFVKKQIRSKNFPRKIFYPINSINYKFLLVNLCSCAVYFCHNSYVSSSGSSDSKDPCISVACSSESNWQFVQWTHLGFQGDFDCWHNHCMAKTFLTQMCGQQQCLFLYLAPVQCHQNPL